MKNKVSEKHFTSLDGGILKLIGGLKALIGGSGNGFAGFEIAYPPDHLCGLAPKTANTDSSSRISNDSDVASKNI